MVFLIPYTSENIIFKIDQNIFSGTYFWWRHQDGHHAKVYYFRNKTEK